MRNTLILLSSLALAASSSAQLNFDFEFGSNVTPEWKSTFQKAADICNATLSTPNGAPVTFRYKVGLAPLGVNAKGRANLGGADTSGTDVDYAEFRSALAANPNKSALDTAALARLETGPTYTVRANDVKVQKDANGDTVFDGDGRGVPDLDANGGYQYVPGYDFVNRTVSVSNATMRAFGLTPTYAPYWDRNGTGLDGYDGIIEFPDFTDLDAQGVAHLNWDFDPSDGIGTGGGLGLDALGTTLHELGHTLGFVSQVDTRDFYVGYNPEDYYNNVSSLDMFRYELVDGQWVRSVQIGSREQFFSADGVEIGERFSMGVMEGGKGWQASHWYEASTDSYAATGYGVMKPVTYKNRPNFFGGSDLAAFDAIGWNLKPVPEPAALLPFALGFLALLRRRR